MSFSELEERYTRRNDTVYVVNFWATWCGPCVKELPHFEKLSQDHSAEKLKVILVSLDFRSKLENTLKPFLLKNRIHSEVVLLNETNANSYIDRVSPEWSGAIPATLILSHARGLRKFYEREFDYKSLKDVYLMTK